MNSVALNLARPIGSTNSGVIPRDLKESIEQASEEFAEKDIDKEIEEFGKKFSDRKTRRRNGKYMEFSERATTGGRDTLSDINLGMNVLASGIRVVSAILTILGADDTTSRNDEYDDSIVTLLSTGATAIKVAAGVLTEYSKLNAGAAKSGEPQTRKDDTEEVLTPEEIKYRTEAAKLVGQFTPEKVKMQQAVVKEAVEKEVIEKGLGHADANKLLKTTLLHNGLPLLEDSGFSLFGDGGVNKVGLAADGIKEDIYNNLPEPGTLEHSVAMGLFRVQQSLNQAFGGLQGDSNYLTRLAGQVGLIANNYVDTGVDKIGLAEEEAQEKGGIIATLISIPNLIGQSVASLVTATAYQPDRIGELPPGVSYSKVTSGLSPAVGTALGLLTTGALGTVAYGFLANSDSDLATSASSYAYGAVEALRRSDLVVAATETLSRVTGSNSWAGGDPEYGEYNNYYDQASFNQGYYDYDVRNAPPPRPYDSYGPNQFGGYDREGFQTNFGEALGEDEFEADPRHDTPMEPIYPDTEVSESRANIEVFQNADAIVPPGQDVMQDKMDPIELIEEPTPTDFYQPEKKDPDTPYVVYSEEHNPWNYLESGQSTEHLYHRRKRGVL